MSAGGESARTAELFGREDPRSGPPAWRKLRDWHEQPDLIAWWEVRVRGLFRLLPPERMRTVLSLAATALCIPRALSVDAKLDVSTGWRLAVLLPLLLGLPWLVYLAARRLADLPRPLRQNPQVALHLLLWGVFALAWFLPAQGEASRALVLLVAGALVHMIWRLGYLLKSGQRGHVAKTGFAQHFFYIRPVWSGSDTPYGKGYEYLVRHQAATSLEFARSQLAGFKLIGLSLLWLAVQYLWAGAVFGDPDNEVAKLLRGRTLGIPRFDALVAHHERYSLVTTWAALYCQLVWVTLLLAARGHLWIGWLRLLGFNVFRNTYKPLLAESIVDFWNRYYFYFKELLVEFFFYPTFVRFQVRRWLRTLLAVFAAAFFGNLYFHLISHADMLVAGDFEVIRASFASRVVYCFALATGIWVSMLREPKRRGQSGQRQSSVAGRFLRIGGVWTFFALIHIWDPITSSPGLEERTRFFLSLFGL